MSLYFDHSLLTGKRQPDIFGGGQGGNKMYGARSQSNPLSKATTLVAILFMFMHRLGISLNSGSTSQQEVTEDLAEQQAEAQKTQMVRTSKVRLISHRIGMNQILFQSCLLQKTLKIRKWRIKIQIKDDRC